MQLVLSHQMSRGLKMMARRLRRLIMKFASGFFATGEMIGDAKHLMNKHHDLLRRGDKW